MALLATAPLASLVAEAQSPPTVAPPNTSPYILPTWTSALNAPGPIARALGDLGPVIPQTETDLNLYGLLGTYQPNGATLTATNAFFQSLGTNGRTCATCHQPSAAMSVSGADIVGRYIATNGTDPLFAPVDGANCPSAVPAANTSKSYLGGRVGAGRSMAEAHSLLLTRGVFRIFLPMPANPEFTLRVVSDPNGCNTDPAYAQVSNASGGMTQMVSVYRRPLMATNLKFVLESPNQFGAAAPPVVDPGTGGLENGNIMWDGRELTLETQATDATLGHAQALQPPTAEQVAQMVSFEMGIFSAQQSNWFAGNLGANGALGGPVDLSTNVVVSTGFGGGPAFTTYDSFSAATGNSLSALQQASIYRGQEIFNNRQFSLASVPTFITPPGGAPAGPPGAPPGPVSGSCALCHGLYNVGADQIVHAQHAVGVGGDAYAYAKSLGLYAPPPARDLPIFELTCPAATPNGYFTTTVQTNDPGRALITGKCADIGSFTVAPLRGLAAHAPYFHDGSAPTLMDVVNFYQARLNIGLSYQDKIDLVNFLAAL